MSDPLRGAKITIPAAPLALELELEQRQHAAERARASAHLLGLDDHMQLPDHGLGAARAPGAPSPALAGRPEISWKMFMRRGF